MDAAHLIALISHLVSSTQQASTSTSGPSTSTSTVHKLSALGYIAVAQVTVIHVNKHLSNLLYFDGVLQFQCWVV